MTGLSHVPIHTLAHEVANRLREAIRTGELPLGARLVEREIAARLGVSRIPVREAIYELIEEGLVRKTPNRAAVVHSPTRREIEEICSLRVVLECFVVERVIAAWRAPGAPAHAAQLAAHVAAMRQAAADDDIHALIEQDYQFHRRLWEIADHALLLEVVTGLRARINRFLAEATAALPPSQRAMHLDSHDTLIALLQAGDVAAACAEMTRHVEGAKQRILTHVTLPAPLTVEG